MDKFKKYVVENFEQFFVLIVLVSTALINHLVDQKIAFLNFFFLPVILSAYYLGVRKSVLGAFFAILLVSVYVVLEPTKFTVRYNSHNLYLHVIVWGSFLLLSAAVVGSQKENLEKSVSGILALNRTLETKQVELNNANKSLKEYSENLEGMVKTRTQELESSRRSTEVLKEKVESALFSTIDSAVAKLIIEGRLRSDKRQISVMFVDIVGFTTYSEERNPELVVKDVNQFLERMEPILSSFHGHLDKFLGDGIMCQFGAPIDFEHYRLLAVLTAVKMQETMSNEEFPWKMRIGIASGAAITGLIGARRQSYTSIGDVVNVASRLEKKCPEGSIVVDQDTFDGCKDFFETHPFYLDSTSENDFALRSKLNEIQGHLKESRDPEILSALSYQQGTVLAELGDLDDALVSYENAIRIFPTNEKAKIALAEMVIARDRAGLLQVKGRKKAVRAYQITRLKDPLADTDRIPASLYQKFRPAIFTIAIPDDLVLRVEALDGSIGHAKTVALLSYAIATRLNIFDKENYDILIAGFTADLGKEIVPHHLLNRRGALNSAEMAEVHRHPMESVRILTKLGYNTPSLLEIVACTHERLDGSGYPRGLKGNEIPLGSRIVAVADAYAAMTSKRPYREKYAKEATLDELQKLARAGKYEIRAVSALSDLINETPSGEETSKANTPRPVLAS